MIFDRLSQVRLNSLSLFSLVTIFLTLKKTVSVASNPHLQTSQSGFKNEVQQKGLYYEIYSFCIYIFGVCPGNVSIIDAFGLGGFWCSNELARNYQRGDRRKHHV